jgi:hypothetical protein
MLLITFALTPLADAQSHDFQEMNYSVFLDGENTSLNINPVFQFQNELNRLSFDINYDSDFFRLGGTWLITALEEAGYKTEAAFSILTEPNGEGFTAGIGVEGKNYLENNRALLYELRYILDGTQFEYRLGYETPIVANNKLMVGIGNSYWHDKTILLEIGFKVQF